MAKVSVIKQSLMLCREAGITMFIWGHRGLGKSSLVHQVAVENGWGFIDLRCSQLEASDIRGLPSPGEDGRTHYLPPADMPIGDLTHDEIRNELGEVPPEGDINGERIYYQKLQNMQRRFQRGIMFLDEVNRAQDDVLQAVFQLVLDRRVGQYVLPPGWCLVAAGNFMEGYQVSGFSDPAFLDRFCHVILSAGETTLEEWVHYMSSVYEGQASEVIEFASQNVKHLDGDVQADLGFSIQPSRRSWESVIKVGLARSRGNYSEDAYTTVLGGLIGHDLASTFARYSCPVKPRALLAEGVKKYEKKLQSLQRNQTTGLMWGLVSFTKNRLDDDAVATVCLDFAEFMAKHMNDKDIVVAFCRALISGGTGQDSQEKARAAVLSNPRLAAMVANYNLKKKDHKKNFIDRLHERPQLHKLLSNIAWGVDDSGDE